MDSTSSPACRPACSAGAPGATEAILTCLRVLLKKPSVATATEKPRRPWAAKALNEMATAVSAARLRTVKAVDMRWMD